MAAVELKLRVTSASVPRLVWWVGSGGTCGYLLAGSGLPADPKSTE
jgi:hypothetical protein